ncbi:hypothetical protein ACJJTC_002445 [Scirpophaga incertulas]
MELNQGVSIEQFERKSGHIIITHQGGVPGERLRLRRSVTYLINYNFAHQNIGEIAARSVRKPVSTGSGSTCEDAVLQTNITPLNARTQDQGVFLCLCQVIIIKRAICESVRQ